VNSEEFWYATFLAAIISGKSVDDATTMADDATRINRTFAD
jgi:hypothetical protein